MLLPKQHTLTSRPSRIVFSNTRRSLSGPTRWYPLIPLLVFALVILACVVTPPDSRAGDWPTYRHDNARSGVTSETIKPPLTAQWVYKSRVAPQPAWGKPKDKPVENILELPRVHFDDTFQVVASDGKLFFGSSGENKVICLDGATGHIRWTRRLGGPIRLAPTIAGGRLYVGCDDGRAYCLDADTGETKWVFQGAPEDRRVLGHGRLISLWPMRTGVLVDGEVAYLSAGIFPSEGVFLYALDPVTGKEIWRNDSCGETPNSRISPQGYLLASDTTLYVPMGRSSPAAFSRSNGALKYEAYFGKTVGGTYALLAGDAIVTGTETMQVYNKDTRDVFAQFPGRRMVVRGKTAYLASDQELAAVSMSDKSVQWKIRSACPHELILAGNVLIGGGDGQVVAVDVDRGERLWDAKVEGAAKGLAVADGRLIVSTDLGWIYSFAPGEATETRVVEERTVKSRSPADQRDAYCRQAAATILKASGIRRGKCLVLGIENGELALELARQSDLTVYAVSPDRERVERLRKAADDEALYGHRVMADAFPLDAVPYADYFANLVVSETCLLTGRIPASAAEAWRMVKPLGGVLMIGQAASMPEGISTGSAQAWRTWIDEADPDATAEVRMIDDGASGRWVVLRRGALPGAGSWTHEYANTGNTACGDDQLVRAPFQVLWFGHPGPHDMVNRHARAASPLSIDGRMFVQGEGVVMAYDIYNGEELWKRQIPGAMRTNASHDSSNLALNRSGLFVATGQQCLQLDPATGETVRSFALPGKEQVPGCRWGYIACTDKLLLGSRCPRGLTSDLVFAYDLEDGKLQWSCAGKQIPHAAIAMGDDVFYYVTNDVTDDERQEVLDLKRRRIAGLEGDERRFSEDELKKPDIRRVVAVNLDSGRQLWQRPTDLTNCGGWHAARGRDDAMLGAMYQDGILLFFGIYLDGHYWEQFFAGQFASRRLLALSGETGQFQWSRHVGFRVRPLIIGDTLHAEPWAFDLRTGEPRYRVNPVTGEREPWQFARSGHHCGCPVASPTCLFFRSYNLGYYDLTGDYGTVHFGAQRPGCWINFIPAGGLLLMPEASAGCMCPFPNMCSVVFEPASRLKGYGMFSAASNATRPAKRLAVNLGALGDRKDTGGQLWLSYPRPFTGRLVLPLELQADFYPGGTFRRGSAAYSEAHDTDDPWLFASWADGLRRLTVPLVRDEDGPASYSVTLFFLSDKEPTAGKRVVDVKLQGELVRKGFDVNQTAGSARTAVAQKFSGITVENELVMELASAKSRPAADEWPVLCGVEIQREKVLNLGCAVPAFELSDSAPKQTQEVRLANLLSQPFRGSVQLEAPEGFQLAAATTSLVLEPGERTTIAVDAQVSPSVKAGRYSGSITLVREDGAAALKRAVAIEHLGPQRRAVIKASEDTYVSNRYPTRNQGTARVLLVDGGDSTMGDDSHNLGLLKFEVPVKGRLVSARLRIYNAGNPTSHSGKVRLVNGPWKEREATYANRPEFGSEVGSIGPVSARQVLEIPLDLPSLPEGSLSLALDPVNTDGTDYLTREAGQPAELILEYVPE